MASPSFASAHSTEPSLESAAVEAAEELLQRLGGSAPDLLMAFCAGPWSANDLALPDLSRRLQELTGARTLLGCTAVSVLEGTEELEGRPALALFGAVLPDTKLTPFRLNVHREYGGEFAFEGMPELAHPAQCGLLLFGDPFSFPMPAFLPALAESHPGLVVSGGMASGGSGPGTHLLFLDQDALPEGAIGVTIEGDVELISAVSQGCRPVGDAHVVTASDGHLVRKLRGEPAANVMLRTLEELPAPERELFRTGAYMGLALDPTLSEFQASDLLARGVMGFNPQDKSIAVAATEVRTGMTVQFMVRDAESASDELERLLAAGSGEWTNGLDPMGGLLFTCSGRGQDLFGSPHHDTRGIQAELGPRLPLAGLFAGGEIGMVSGRPFLHGYTASLALLRSRVHLADSPSKD
ncbi:MAG: small ligand-binding sensory domain FIST [Planctomycetota bacterium]|jgi:small ligand-binding sensory domain FIST